MHDYGLPYSTIQLLNQARLFKDPTVSFSFRHERDRSFSVLVLVRKKISSRSRKEKNFGPGQKKKFGPGTTLPISIFFTLNCIYFSTDFI